MVNNNDIVRVAVIGPRGFDIVQGGIETHCKVLYSMLAASGRYTVDYYYVGRYGKNRAVVPGIKMIPVESVSSKHLEKIVYGLGCFFRILLSRPDIVHIHGLNTALFAPLFRLAGLKVALTVHSQDYKYPKWGRLAKAVLRYSEKLGMFSHSVFAVGKQVEEDLKQKHRNVTLMMSGVMVPDVSAEDILSVRKDMGIPDGKYILFVGRLTPEKEIHTLIQAYLESNVESTLVIVGGGDPADAYVQKLKSAAEGNPRIIFTGAVTGKPVASLFRGAALFVLPSCFEACSVALLEAVSCGVPVFASDIPANRNLGFPDSVYFPLGDSGTLADALRRHDRGEYPEEVRRLSQQVVQENYRWEGIVDIIEKEYRSMVHHR